MTPCFSVEDLETLDAFLAANREKVPNEDRKKLVRVKGGAEAKAYQPKYLPLEMQEETSRECNACKTVRKLSELSRCSSHFFFFFSPVPLFLLCADARLRATQAEDASQRCTALASARSRRGLSTRRSANPPRSSFIPSLPFPSSSALPSPSLRR